jgi:hypothetical protein
VNSSSFKINYLEPEQYSRWDSFLSESVNGTVFQSSAYFQAVSRSFQRQVKVLTVSHQDQILGGAVLFPKKKWNRQYLTTPFFIPYNSFIISSFLQSNTDRRRSRYQSEVLDLLRAELEKENIFIQMDLTAGVTDFRCLVWNKWQFTPAFNIIIHLHKESDLFAQMRRNQKRDIRTFEKQNYEIKTGQDSKVLFQLMEQSYQNHRLKPPLPETIFKTFVSDLLAQKLADYFVLEADHRPVAAMLTILDRERVYALFSGRDFQANWSEAELFLHWHLMRYYQDKGIKIFDLLGGMVDSIAHFKFGLGGTLLRYDQIYFFRNYPVEVLYKAWKKNKKSQRAAEQRQTEP